MNLKDYTYKGRVSITNTKNSMRVRIPMNRNLVYISILILTTFFWCLGLFMLIDLFLKLHNFYYKLFLFFGFLVWNGIGLAGVSFFMWIFFGRERIVVNKDYFITEKPLIFFFRRNIYNINDVSKIRIDKETFKINRNGTWVENQRTVLKFDTPKKHVVFARNIAVSDAEYILLLLAKCKYLKAEQFAIVM